MPYCSETLSPYGLWVSMVSVTPMETRVCAWTPKLMHSIQATAVNVLIRFRPLVMNFPPRIELPQASMRDHLQHGQGMSRRTDRRHFWVFVVVDTGKASRLIVRRL